MQKQDGNFCLPSLLCSALRASCSPNLPCPLAGTQTPASLPLLPLCFTVPNNLTARAFSCFSVQTNRLPLEVSAFLSSRLLEDVFFRDDKDQHAVLVYHSLHLEMTGQQSISSLNGEICLTLSCMCFYKTTVKTSGKRVKCITDSS